MKEYLENIIKVYTKLFDAADDHCSKNIYYRVMVELTAALNHLNNIKEE